MEKYSDNINSNATNGHKKNDASKLNVVFSCSKTFVMPAGVMLCSLFENNRDVIICVYALYTGDSKYLSPLQKIVERYVGEFIPCDKMPEGQILF